MDWHTSSIPVVGIGCCTHHGASSGIGRAAALYLASRGFTVVAGVRKDADMTSLREEAASSLPLSSSSSSAPLLLHPVLLDVTSAVDVASALHTVEAMGLPLAGIINNAGLAYPLPIELSRLDRVREVYEVNVVGVIAMVQTFAPLLRASKGRVINVGSVTGRLAVQCDGVYASSKHAVEGLTDSLRLELGRWGVSVSLIVPGQVASSMWEKWTGDNSPARQHQRQKKEEGEEEGDDDDRYTLYQDLFDQVDRAVSSFLPRLSSPASTTSLAIHSALTSPRPLTRYLVAGLNGVPLWVLWPLLPWVPDRLMDLIKLQL